MSPVKDLMEAVKRAMDKNKKPVIICPKCWSNNVIIQVKEESKLRGYLCLNCGKEF